METKVIAGQTVFDVAVEQGGTVEAAISLILNNNISMTEELTAGQTLKNPEIKNPEIVEYYRIKGIRPTTTENAVHTLGGIGYMGINIDFIVS